MTSHTAYLKPPWMQRNIANRLVPMFQRRMVSKLSVQGRKSGRWHTVPVAVLELEGQRYLVSYRGESDWAKNLRASLNARLDTADGIEQIEAREVPVEERPHLLEVYQERYGKMPTVAGVLRALPQPADHPIFLITRSTGASKQ